ncbi:MAG: thioredoxin family protein [Parvularculales bacterium]
MKKHLDIFSGSWLKIMMAVAALLFCSAASSDVPSSTRMIMVTSAHCPWCHAFEEEVGQFYDRTPESKVYPILRVDITDQLPAEFADLDPSYYTPTFIFVRDGEEQGRIEGYPGQELWWWRIGEFLPE